MADIGMRNKSREKAPLAVILAAGEGARLSDGGGGCPKPLAKVLGLSLAERALCSCAKAGIRRFLIVLGHQAEEVEAHFGEIGRRRGFEVNFCEAEGWRRGNGASALAAVGRVGEGPFFLIMADHLVDPEIYRLMLEDPPRAGEVCLAVDRAGGNLFDAGEATKVRIEEDRVCAIGKGLSNWDGVDTGVFSCDGGIFESLALARGRGCHALSDAVSELAERGAVRAVDVAGKYWIDVDTPASLREGGRRLIASLRPGKGREDGFVSAYLNRLISIRISALLARTPITANQVTLLSFLTGIVGAVFFAVGGYFSMLLGGCLVQLSSIIDGCDGDIARLKETVSAKGGWLDTVLDRYADLAMAIAVTYAYAEAHPGNGPWLGGMMAVAAFVLASYVTKEFQIRFGVSYPNDWLNRLKRRDLRIFLVFIGALAGRAYEALLAAGGLTHFLILGIILKGWFWSAAPSQPLRPLEARRKKGSRKIESRPASHGGGRPTGRAA